MSPFGSEGREGVYGKRLFEIISQPRSLNNQALDISASIGLAIYRMTQKRRSADKYADEAMYAAKKERKLQYSS
jgi:GGDEF domain-containing protein